jgi:hypothetical protein
MKNKGIYLSKESFMELAEELNRYNNEEKQSLIVDTELADNGFYHFLLGDIPVFPFE